MLKHSSCKWLVLDTPLSSGKN
uniref:Uncharacterized protein n=1 Tax=Anguilla anguilla TaxID=7936 RepID=A0A0E9PN09_ANGAN